MTMDYSVDRQTFSAAVDPHLDYSTKDKHFPMQGLRVRPFAAYIQRCGLRNWQDAIGHWHTELQYSDRFSGEYRQVDVHKHDSVVHLTRDYINCTDVSSQNNQLTESIKQYYTMGLAAAQLAGTPVSLHQRELMRIFNNDEQFMVEHQDDFNSMRRIVQFYHEDLLVDKMLHDCVSASGYVDSEGSSVPINTTVTMLTVMQDQSKAGKKTNTVYAYCKNDQKHLFKIKMTGSLNAVRMLNLLALSDVRFTVKSANAVTVRTSLGTGLSYIECYTADFTLSQ